MALETPPDTNVRSVLPSLGQLTRPENDVCVATLGAGPGAQPDGESVPCGPPQIGAKRGAIKGYKLKVTKWKTAGSLRNLRTRKLHEGTKLMK